MYSRDRKSRLTSEVVNRLFKNNFELANYAIALARYHIKRGEEVRLGALIDEVCRNPDPSYLKDLAEEDAQEELS